MGEGPGIGPCICEGCGADCWSRVSFPYTSHTQGIPCLVVAELP